MLLLNEHNSLLFRIFTGIILAVSICFSGCSKDDKDDPYLSEPLCQTVFVPKSSQYKVIGFYPSWRKSTLPMSEIQYSKLTRVVYSFAVPNSDGTMDLSDISDISDLVDIAHSHGVEVYFSVGGGDGSTNFAWIATKKEYMDRFVNEVCDFVFRNCLDGVDIDWEYWTPNNGTVFQSESSAFLYVVKSINAKLKPYNKGISIDLGASSWSGRHFYNDVIPFIDEAQIMCYDFTGPWSAPGPHSSYEQSIGSGSSVNSTGLAYWIGYRGWPKEKIVLGVPFYGRDFDNGGGEGISYSDILILNPDAYKYDRVDNIYYNGTGTISRKIQYVIDNKLPGIMIWEIGQDSSADSTSLLNAIYKTIYP